MSITATTPGGIGEKKFFMKSRTSCLQGRITCFWAQGWQNESNSDQLARVGEKKIFHELDEKKIFLGSWKCVSLESYDVIISTK